MQIQSGYKTVTPIQWTNALWALQRGIIGAHAFRTYLACFALVAIREAAGRAKTGRAKKTPQLNRYRASELERLTDLRPRSVRAALRQLDAAGLVAFREDEIAILTEPLPGSERLLEELSCQRSPRRPIPTPRALLRFLARNRSMTVTLVIIAYVLRGLSITRGTGEISGKGTVKASWIADVFGPSIRAVKYAQATLQKIGWISKDTQSHQRKLNRHGAYFVINLDWTRPMNRPAAQIIALEPQHSQTAAQSSCSPFVNRDKCPSEIAPPSPVSGLDFAPPIENRETSIERIQEPETQPAAERAVTGVQVKGEGPIAANTPLPTPNLDRIVVADLYQMSRIENLYDQAVERRWFPASDARALDFLAAAIHARTVGNDPPKLFGAIVRRHLWRHISLAEEDQARRAIARRRERDPDYCRATEPGCPGKVSNSVHQDAARPRSHLTLPVM